MNFEIVGVHPANKGALLMLEAIRERLLATFPSARFGVPLTWPAEQRIELGLWAVFPREFGPLDCTFLMSLIPRRIRNRLGLFAAEDIDVILDASGFGYGDHWGVRKTARRLPGRKGGQVIVLLPQALGPFKGAGMARAFLRVLRIADLVFVRDPISMRHVESLGEPPGHVRMCPDFTCLLHPELPAHLNHLDGAGLIIPNRKVAEGDPRMEECYLDFLWEAAVAIQNSGRRVVLLVHEGAGDIQLAEKLNRRLSEPLEIINEHSPLVTKAVIGRAALTVSSRFHGLVSALSAAVPSLACGWSHKYDALMSDYGCGDLQVDLADRASWQGSVDRLIRAADDAALKKRLQSASRAQSLAAEAMWAEVVSLIEGRR